MFGYIRFLKPELKIKDYETYRAVYCSLCKELGKSYGVLSRFTLSYDFTFFALLIFAMDDKCPEFKKGRCAFNPLKKCNYCKNRDGLKKSSAAAMITLYYKLLDNIADNRGFKKAGYKIIKPIFSSARKKAAKDYPETEKIIGEYIKEQNALESIGETRLDAAAEPTAQALSKLFCTCSCDQNQKRVLQRLGYCLGRYIYILDAAADFGDDLKSGAYNVFKYSCKTADEVSKRAKPQLYTCINEAAKAFELLDIKRYKDILGNVIYLGLEETFLKEIKDEQSV